MKHSLKLCPECNLNKIPCNITRCYSCNTKRYNSFSVNTSRSYIFEVLSHNNINYLENMKELKLISSNGKNYIILRSIKDFYTLDNCIHDFCKKNHKLPPEIILDLKKGRIILINI